MALVRSTKAGDKKIVRQCQDLIEALIAEMQHDHIYDGQFRENLDAVCVPLLQ